MRNILKLSAIAVLVASLSACAVGPDYQTPAKVADISFNSPYQQAEQAQSWWQAFDDAALNQLISRALVENRTLAQARANVDRAYAVFRDANNDFLPKGTLDAGYQASENPTLSPADDGVITRGYSTGASLSWDLDLFGKLRRASEAAEAQAQQADILWHDAQVQLAEPVEDRLVGRGHMLDAQARVLGRELAEDFPGALLVAMPLGLHGQAVHRHRERQRCKMHMAVLRRIVQHGIEMDLVDLGHRHDVPGQRMRHLDVVLALEHEQVPDLERLAAVADVELAVARDRALVHTKDAHLADIGVDRDLEHMRQHVQRRVRLGLHGHGLSALANDEARRVSFGRIGQELDDYVQQLGHAGTAARRGAAFGVGA